MIVIFLGFKFLIVSLCKVNIVKGLTKMNPGNHSEMNQQFRNFYFAIKKGKSENSSGSFHFQQTKVKSLIKGGNTEKSCLRCSEN